VALSRIAAAIDALPRTELRQLGYRHQAVEWRYSQPGAGARTAGGRWNPPNSFATLYLGLSVEVAAAELRRLARRAGRELADCMPRHLLEYEVQLTAVLDLTDPGALETVELNDAELRSTDAARCQRIGEAAHHLGWEAILAPSATGTGNIVAVFVERLLPQSNLEVRSATVWEVPPEMES
jgi:RES domain-containing protein